VEDRRIVGHDAVNVSVDEELVVSTVDRVVQDRSVQAHLDVRLRQNRPEKHDGVPYLRGQALVDALVGSTFGNVVAVRVAEQQPDPRASTRTLDEKPVKAHVLGNEHPGVDQDADLTLGVAEEVAQGVARYGPAMGIYRDDFALGDRGDLIAAECVRPQVGLIHTEMGGHGVPVRAVWRTGLGDPALNGLGVHLDGISERIGGLPALQQERSQPLVRHFTQTAGRTGTASP
jgi:hypothetical protein